MARRKQKSCHQCRSRHLKCDGQEPCQHCRRGARECSKDSKHIFLNESEIGIVRRRKKHSLRFEGDQMWIELPSVKFADSTASIPSSPDESCRPTPAPNISANLESSTSPPALYFDSDSTSQASVPIDPALQELCGDWSDHFKYCWKTLQAGQRPDPSQSATLSTRHVQWPLTNYQEALLMRHYVQQLASWFDSCDGATHFAFTIPELASNSPALLNAIFALAAKHLSLLGRLAESVSLRYIDICYQALLPEVDTKAFEAEHLAAVLILRLVMQMTESKESYEEGNVFLGVEVFLAACKANPRSSLHHTLFLDVLRLYIHVSFMTRKPLMDVEKDCDWIIASLSSVTGQARIESAKITLHAAKCVNYAYGDQPKTWDRWLQLRRFAEEWEFNKPEYFRPVFTQEDVDGDPFPRRLFATDLYATTHQFFANSQLLLVNNQPATPPPLYLSISPMTKEQIEEHTLVLIRNIVGTAWSHFRGESAAAACFLATLAIIYGGHLLRDRLSQEHAYGLLHRAQRECAGLFPNSEFLRLRQIWGWDTEESVAFQNVL